MIVTGSSTFGLKMFGPKTVAKFWTLILFTPEYDWTSSRNLYKKRQIYINFYLINICDKLNVNNRSLYLQMYFRRL